MFRFTIRELVLLTLVVAMGVAWWLDRRQLAIPAADFKRLKADEAARLNERARFYKFPLNTKPSKASDDKWSGASSKMASPLP